MSEIAGPVKPFLSDAARIPREMVALAMTTAQRTQAATSDPEPKVRERHKMVVFLHLAGWTNKEIAEEMGYGESRVSIILNSPNPGLKAVRDQAASKIMENVVDVGTKIQLSAHEAFNVMHGLLSSADENTKRLAAKDLLDRAGFAPIKKNLNLDARVPTEDLSSVLPRIADANEVVAMAGPWEVRQLPPKEKTA